MPLAGLAALSRPLESQPGGCHPAPEGLAARVDLAAVRGEMRRKLNEGSPSTIARLSDPSIQWLARGIPRLGIAGVGGKLASREELCNSAARAEG